MDYSDMTCSLENAAKIPPTYHNKYLKRLNRHISKVAGVLISIGHYSFDVNICVKPIALVKNKMARIYGLPPTCIYTFLTVWEDGYISCHVDSESVEYETKTSSISNLKYCLTRKN